jgi:hypothetical protein
MFELQSQPLTGALAEVWPNKTIREMPYKELRTVMAKAPEDWRAEALAAAAIDVTLDELIDLPGRFAGAVANLLSTVTRMHGLGDSDEVPEPAINGTPLQEAGNPAGKH